MESNPLQNPPNQPEIHQGDQNLQFISSGQIPLVQNNLQNYTEAQPQDQNYLQMNQLAPNQNNFNFLYNFYNSFQLLNQEMPNNLNLMYQFVPQQSQGNEVVEETQGVSEGNNQIASNSNNMNSVNNLEINSISGQLNNRQVKEEKVSQTKFKESYVDLLIKVIEEQLEKKSITEEYLNTDTKSQLNENFYYRNLIKGKEEENSGNMLLNCEKKACDNKACSFVASKPNQLFKAKFTSIYSFKPKTLWVCEKCFYAFNAGNYCYYCNGIYMEPEYNSQYCDKKKWIQCDYCERWTHIHCLQKKGKCPNIEKLNNPNYKYVCPLCKKNQENSSKGQKNKKTLKTTVYLGKKRKENKKK